MTAQKRTSPIEDMMMLASKLPWWGGILLALVSYLILHLIASRPVAPLGGPGQMGDFMAKSLVRTFAMFGQLILPVVFSVGAIISAINAARQKKLYDNVAARPDVSALNEISWQDFERLVSEYYRRRGFKVTHEGGNGHDGGIDLVLRQKSESYLVQCKQWRAYKVGVQPVREFYGVMASRRAAGGYFITSGEFTGEALAFARGLNLELVDGRKLRQMIDIARKVAALSNIPDEPQKTARTPVCPQCGAEMKTRVARQGSQAGKEFWGCVNYPKCKGTRPLEDTSRAGWVAPDASEQSSAVSVLEKRNCPQCGNEMTLRQFQSGPKSGQQFHACSICKKGWPVQQAG